MGSSTQKETVGVFLDSGSLFRISYNAYQRTAQSGKPPRAADQEEDALIAIVFGAAAVEAYINELAAVAGLLKLDFGQADKTMALGAILKEAEDGRGQPALKFHLLKYVCTGETWNEGDQPFQDFKLLFELRNALVHLKPFDKIHSGVGTTPNDFTPYGLVRKFEAKGLLAELPSDVQASWMAKIGTGAMAEWAFQTSEATAVAIYDILPPGLLKASLTVRSGKLTKSYAARK